MERAKRIWSETWRIAASLILGLLVYGLVADAATRDPAMAPLHWAFYWIDIVVGLICIGLMTLRHRWPLAITSLVLALTCVSSFGSVAALLCLVSLGTHRRWRDAAVVGPITMASAMVFELIWPGATTGPNWLTTMAFNALLASLAWAIGSYIGARRDLVVTLQSRAETAEREQTLRVVQAQITERSRIAREMHDVVAHRISLIAIQANAIAYRPDLPRDQVQGYAELIRDNADAAIQELRGVLGVLRGPMTPGLADPSPGSTGPGGVADGSTSREPSELDTGRPQPTLVDLPELVDHARDCGSRVTTHVAIPIHDVPTGLSRTAFRIVQECLTNARKHAGDRDVRVAMTGVAGQTLDIEVRNPAATTTPAATPSGFGLIGLTERAVLAGGELTYGLDRAGDFVVRARLPWPLGGTS